jgi:hypothetical protein
MRRLHRPIGLALAVGMFLTLCVPAQAYIDGGSGSYLLQILFASLFGAAFTVRTYLRNFKTVLVRRYSSAKSQPVDRDGA